MARHSSEKKEMHDRWMDRSTGAEAADEEVRDQVTTTGGNPDIRDRLTDTTARDEEMPEDDENALGGVLGSFTGEEDRDPVPGGWEGTDDATSTAPSDLSETPDSGDVFNSEAVDPDEAVGRAYGGGIGEDDGGVVDIKGSPVGDSRDWEHDPPVERERE